MLTKISTDNINTSSLSELSGGPKITTINATDSNYNNLNPNQVSTSGGFLKVIGNGFTSPMQLYINETAATSVTYINSTEIRAQVPARAAGSYVVYIFRVTDGGYATKINGVTYA